MSDEPVTSGELTIVFESLQGEMRRGFDQVNARLDRVNGRLDKHGEAITEHTAVLRVHGQQIVNLEREVYDRPRLAPTVATVPDEQLSVRVTPAVWKFIAKALAGAAAAGYALAKTAGWL